MKLRRGYAGVGPCLEPGLSQSMLGCLEGPLLVQDQSVPEFALTSFCLPGHHLPPFINLLASYCCFSCVCLCLLSCGSPTIAFQVWGRWLLMGLESGPAPRSYMISFLARR